MKYYTDPKVNDRGKGLLPFRCWQIYNEMVDAVKKRDTTRYVCAAGILSHYVGDACQPLHISYMFNGDPAKLEKVTVTKKALPRKLSCRWRMASTAPTKTDWSISTLRKSWMGFTQSFRVKRMANP